MYKLYIPRSAARITGRQLAIFGALVLMMAAVYGCLFMSGAHAQAQMQAETAPNRPVAAGIPRPDHVIIVIEENHSYADIIGAAAAPYINSLAAQGALFTDSHAIEHPSQPNYLDIFSGANQGVTDDSCPHSFQTDNLAKYLLDAGLTFTGYSEDLPSPGSLVCTSGKYARKHSPWINFTNVPTTTNQPLTSFPTDYSTLPTLSFVIPNLDNDMHDGTIQQGDTWLQQHLNGYVQWATTHNSLFVLTWDEDDFTSANQIATIFVGPMVNSGHYPEHINHYNVLRTLEDMYDLSYAGQSAGSQPITDTWQGGNTPTATPTAPPMVNTATSTSTPTTVATSTIAPSNTITPTVIVTGTAMPSYTPTRAATATGSPTATTCALTFADVPPSNTFYPAIRCLACMGIVSGYPCGSPGEPCDAGSEPYFRYGSSITRAQISKIVALSAGYNDPPGSQIYEDVPENTPFYTYINQLSEHGAMGGYSCGRPGEPCGGDNRPYFRPGANATRGQLTKIVSNAAMFSDTPSGQTYADVRPGDAFYIYIERLSSRGVIGGYPCGPNVGQCGAPGQPPLYYFLPNNPVTRGQAAKIVGNAFFPDCRTTPRK